MLLNLLKITFIYMCVCLCVYRYISFGWVAQSCLTLCNPMNCSMPGLLVHHQLPEFTQTHVQGVGDTIQPPYPLLLSPSLPALNLSQHQGLFKWVSSSHQVANVLVSVSTSVLPTNTQDWSPLGWTGWISLQSKGLSIYPWIVYRTRLKSCAENHVSPEQLLPVI